MNDTKSIRMDWMDVSKGLGIILVVLGHSERGLLSSGIAPASWKFGLDFYLYTFHMPLFMFLAGLNVPHSLRVGPRDFLLRKLLTVAWPYVLWSVVFGTATTLLGSLTNNPGSFSDIAKIAWQPISPFWFLYSIFLYYGLVAITGPRAILLLPLSIATFGLGLLFVNDSLLQQTFHFLIFFVMGVFFAPRLVTLSIEPKWWVEFSAIVAWFAVTTGIATPSNHDYFSFWGLPSAVLGIVFVVMLSLKLNGMLRSILAELGKASMPIYVMHVFATAGTRIALSRMQVTDSPSLHLLIGTTAGVLGPYIVYKLLSRLRWLPAFGFGRNPPVSATT